MTLLATKPAKDEALPEDQLVVELCNKLSDYLEQEQIDNVIRAVEYARRAHFGQFRKSGEAYVCHPLSVAVSLSGMRMDVNGIMAAILHDVIEDSQTTKKDLAAVFNEEVAELVDGVSKLGSIENKSKQESKAESVRKMILATAKDLRVIMVKLADRLHNMKTLGAMGHTKQRLIARETLDIYVPLAARLGMNDIRHQLEMLSFAALYPMRNRILAEAVRKSRGNRTQILTTIEKTITQRLNESALVAKVSGREKHLYSIYKKMQRKKISFSDVFDVYAFRIYCHDADTCYRILGVIHSLFRPLPGRFKDYIALPKANGYQSLHTIMVGPYGIPLEIQIRTFEMHQLSETGIAAHWLYKKGDKKASESKERAKAWLHDLLELLKEAGDSVEFIDNLKVDLFPKEVFVFTPKGLVVKMPRGSSIVDFAYAVHTDVGNKCVSARVNRRLVPLQTQLGNGMTVDVVTHSTAEPNPIWLNYVVTAKARSAIRSYLKHLQKGEAISLGKRLFKRELKAIGLTKKSVSTAQLNELVYAFSLDTLEQLYQAIGLGDYMPFVVVQRLVDIASLADKTLASSKQKTDSPLLIKGTEGIVISLPQCCRPLPGDPIIGYFNPGRGIVIHRLECKNSSEDRKKQNQWLNVEWSDKIKGNEFSADIRIELLNERGALATIISVISAMDSNIENVRVIEQDERVSVDLITISVFDRVHLAAIIRKLKNHSIVLKIIRVKS
ncbi:MAG: bifunctional (p)ppGpp synthetase/guanosine-3',5'-bis(diphosphate) 3'-pyrophosphohydrolase [Methylococcales bacterium]|nr:bifunctional (p)ppGpp synthetase/guanosine-3',5'-bis(diphosphate) 3'-pyrophosphohydrolase [Methylococcales bacterium]